MIIDKLYREALKSPVCVGLDFREHLLPEYLLQSSSSLEEKIFIFNRNIVEATKDLVACFKLQIACYEALGLEGLKAYSRTVHYIRKKGKITIGDVKRGDIAITAEYYAKAHFSGDFEVDFITVNPYLGEDSISPYYKYLETGEKGIFILIHTSNESSRDFQELNIENTPLYIKVAEKVNDWGKPFIGSNGLNLIGGVVGLTFPEDMKKVWETCPNAFFLIPGYGIQGGKSIDLAPLLEGKRRFIINSSRDIIGAHKGIKESKGFEECAREKVQLMKEDIVKWQR
ncbi:MAG: orotidine-5'-phosphate decarboxylase [Bacteroidales bacterium]|jgi:orotidine-5'-phosphate decarboxylase|nr:orotidine-5'-phosphate decarboxylase [Bacteroidales bacterium]